MGLYGCLVLALLAADLLHFLRSRRKRRPRGCASSSRRLLSRCLARPLLRLDDAPAADKAGRAPAHVVVIVGSGGRRDRASPALGALT